MLSEHTRLSFAFQDLLAPLRELWMKYIVTLWMSNIPQSSGQVVEQTPAARYPTKVSQEYSDSLAKLQEMVETTVDLDALDNHEFIIKPEFDENLRTIRKNLDRLRHGMEAEHRSVGSDLGQEIDKKLFL